jgi:hypothetical protein
VGSVWADAGVGDNKKLPQKNQKKTFCLIHCLLPNFILTPGGEAMAVSRRVSVLFWIGLLAGLEVCIASPAYVIHVLADDLGYHDVNWRNNQTITPNLDKLAKAGIEIPEFYVYKFCAASRGSILSGRYPYHIGM